MAQKELRARIQLIRDLVTNLETKNPDTLNGEFYICLLPDTGYTKFKIGDGRKFNEIAYYEDNLLKVLGIDDSAITKADKQILVYNSESGNWENEVFTDDVTLIYDRALGLSLNGYAEASTGQMPVKGSAGLQWKNPVDDTSLQQAVQRAESAATLASTYASNAGTSATNASVSAGQAAASVTAIKTWVNDKFWWGSLEEYNQLSSITEGSFYFIRTEV